MEQGAANALQFYIGHTTCWNHRAKQNKNQSTHEKSKTLGGCKVKSQGCFCRCLRIFQRYSHWML